MGHRRDHEDREGAREGPRFKGTEWGPPSRSSRPRDSVPWVGVSAQRFECRRGCRSEARRLHLSQGHGSTECARGDARGDTRGDARVPRRHPLQGRAVALNDNETRRTAKVVWSEQTGPLLTSSLVLLQSPSPLRPPRPSFPSPPSGLLPSPCSCASFSFSALRRSLSRLASRTFLSDRSQGSGSPLFSSPRPTYSLLSLSIQTTMATKTLLSVAALTAFAKAAEVVVFGDSWGSFSRKTRKKEKKEKKRCGAAPHPDPSVQSRRPSLLRPPSLCFFSSGQPFQQMFTSRGYNIDVDNTAIGGTTARYWARNPVRTVFWSFSHEMRARVLRARVLKLIGSPSSLRRHGGGGAKELAPGPRQRQPGRPVGLAGTSASCVLCDKRKEKQKNHNSHRLTLLCLPFPHCPASPPTPPPPPPSTCSFASACALLSSSAVDWRTL